MPPSNIIRESLLDVDSGDGRGAPPPSLEKLLTVTTPGAGVTAATKAPAPPSDLPPPTDLLSRLDAFLPQLARANERMPAASDDVVIQTQTQPPAADELTPVKTTATSKEGGAKQESSKRLEDKVTSEAPAAEPKAQGQQEHGVEAGSVEMDLFVDNSLGQLVASEKEAEKLGDNEINALITPIEK